MATKSPWGVGSPEEIQSTAYPGRGSGERSGRSSVATSTLGSVTGVPAAPASAGPSSVGVIQDLSFPDLPEGAFGGGPGMSSGTPGRMENMARSMRTSPPGQALWAEFRLQSGSGEGTSERGTRGKACRPEPGEPIVRRVWTLPARFRAHHCTPAQHPRCRRTLRGRGTEGPRATLRPAGPRASGSKLPGPGRTSGVRQRPWVFRRSA